MDCKPSNNVKENTMQAIVSQNWLHEEQSGIIAAGSTLVSYMFKTELWNGYAPSHFVSLMALWISKNQQEKNKDFFDFFF